MGIKQSRLKELLSYDPDTGLFRWLTSRGRVNKGSVAGCLNGNGYIHIKVDSQNYQAHRLAFLYMTGEMPIEVDHENHNRTDNRWWNLSPSSRAENGRNQAMQSNNTSGVTGVCWDRSRNKWVSQIIGNGKRRHLGYFDALKDAAISRKAAEIKYDYHDNHGVSGEIK